jgi:hypothetical protein
VRLVFENAENVDLMLGGVEIEWAFAGFGRRISPHIIPRDAMRPLSGPRPGMFCFAGVRNNDPIFLSRDHNQVRGDSNSVSTR